MCVLVDTNVAHRVLLGRNDPDYKVVYAALMSKRLVLVYGGPLVKEYNRNTEVRRTVLSLERAGMALRISESLIAEEITWLERNEHCLSNDPHIIALARVSGARLLCSNDGDLGQDFTNKALVDHPRGKIYKSIDHRHLLRKPCRTQR
jgi:predicted nucleic acid-binding protein